MSKVIKLIFVVDDDTADWIEMITELAPKDRDASGENFIFTDPDASRHKLHFVHGEVVLWTSGW